MLLSLIQFHYRVSLNSPRTAYTKFFDILVDKVEFLTADAAPDEQLALVAVLNILFLLTQVVQKLVTYKSRGYWGSPVSMA